MMGIMFSFAFSLIFKVFIHERSRVGQERNHHDYQDQSFQYHPTNPRVTMPLSFAPFRTLVNIKDDDDTNGNHPYMETCNRSTTRSSEDIGTTFNYLTTFNIMTERRLMRRYRGIYKENNVAYSMGVIIFLSYACGLWSLNVRHKFQSSPSEDTDRSSYIFLLLGLSCVISLLVRVTRLIRWLLNWLILATLTSYCLTSNASGFFVRDEALVSPVHKHQHRLIFLGFVIAEVLTVVVYSSTHFLYPYIVGKGWLDSTWWWQIQQASPVSNRWTYRSRVWEMFRKRHHGFSYRGTVDSERRAHGYGIWEGTGFHDERLEGFWHHGVPVGPFQSREVGSGYTFVNRRIAYVSNRGESDLSHRDFVPHHAPALKYGVVSIECSVSGAFFRFLPAIQELVLCEDLVASDHRNAQWCERLLTRPLPEAFDENQKHPPPQHMEAGTVKEALIFFHGFNSPLEYALKVFGQFLTLGNFPPHVHPYVFSWPAGRSPFYGQAKANGARATRTSHDLLTFLQSLIQAGYTRVHFLCHSMGTHVLGAAFQELDTRDWDRVCVPEEDLTPSQSSRKLEISTVTLLNPDYSLEEFIRPEWGFYDQLRRYCPIITMYGDRTDTALLCSEIYSRWTAARFEPSLGRRVHDLSRDTLSDLISSPVESQESRVEVPPASSLKRLNKYLDQETMGNVPLDVVGLTGERDLSLTSNVGGYLDMDVLDTTMMDNNVHSMRHNYFNINPTLVNDIREVILDKTRAKDRDRVVKIKGNVYVFLVAPSYVTNA